MRASELAVGTELPTTTHTYGNVELFQFSAAGWHPHRVHYDLAYTRDTEGHSDLLVHGPLQAVHMVQWLLATLGAGATLRSVSYRHLGVLHVGQTGRIGATVTARDGDTTTFELWMRAEDGGTTTTTGSAVVTQT